MSDTPSVTVIVVEDQDATSVFQIPRPFMAMTVPFHQDLRANGATPEEAVDRLKQVIYSCTYGNKRKLVKILSVPLDELMVEEIMNG